MTTLVTGGTGFLGRPLVRQLLERGEPVHVIARSPAAPKSEVGATVHAVDLLRDRTTIRDLVRDVRPTRLVHLAWTTEPGSYWTSMDNLDWVGASLDLFRAFTDAGGQRALFAGSCAEYAWSTGVLAEASTPLEPATLYGTAKHALRLIIESAGQHGGVSTAWGRLFFLYGPNEQDGRLVSSTLAALRAGRPAAVSEGSQLRDFLHVDDAARALLALLDATATGPVNIGSGTGVPVRELVGTLAELVGRPDLVRYGARPTAPDDPPALVADIGRLAAETGFAPRFNLRSGLLDTVTRTLV
jgi:nucleoside-diphosphate-sugar epimerase